MCGLGCGSAICFSPVKSSIACEYDLMKLRSREKNALAGKGVTYHADDNDTLEGSLFQYSGPSDPGSYHFHHKVIFNQPFASNDYMVQLTCNQGSGQSSIEDQITSRLKSVNVSYLDRDLTTEKIIFAGMGGTGQRWHNVNNYAEKEYFGAMPTRVWTKFETI